MRCKWDRAWIGQCKSDVEEGSEFCEEHSGKVCSGCGGTAVRDCHETQGPLCCGAPLCEKCNHRNEKGMHHKQEPALPGERVLGRLDPARCFIIGTDGMIAARVEDDGTVRLARRLSEIPRALTAERRVRLKELTTDGLMRETLHGKPPLETTMELAVAVHDFLEATESTDAEGSPAELPDYIIGFRKNYQREEDGYMRRCVEKMACHAKKDGEMAVVRCAELIMNDEWAPVGPAPPTDREKVEELGEAIGYGRTMQLCEELWGAKEKARYGAPGGELTVYCCASQLVRCPACDGGPTANCDGIPKSCEWCGGAGRVTKRVANVIEAAEE